MALRITLRPRERIIVNGALIRNGDRNAEILIETRCRFLRESETIHESKVDTPCKQIWMTLQMLHLAEDPLSAHGLLLAQTAEILEMMPTAAPYIAEISQALDETLTHKALKAAKRLVQHEHEQRADTQARFSAA